MPNVPSNNERELRELFSSWTRGASKKDIDAAMAVFAPDAHSYEHEIQLEYRGVDEIREVCQRGFDAAQGDFKWDVPDLRIESQGDLAVAWGLNRMQFWPPDAPAKTIFSRSTRVFRKIEGRWQMIHQHLSYPYDPESGHVLMDLKPEAARLSRTG